MQFVELFYRKYSNQAVLAKTGTADNNFSANENKSGHTMRNLKFYFSTFFFILFIQTISAQQLYKNIGSFELENGKVLKDCKVGYRVSGDLNIDSSNVILFLTWFGGNSEQLQNLLGKDKLIDNSGYYVIAIDALGNGVSTSPSNYDLSTGEDFPEITIKDMVKSQKILLDSLCIKKVHAIIGGSMGSMQVFEWLVTYPSFMKKAVPYVPTPQLSSYDLLLKNLQKHIIESGRRSGTSDRDISISLNHYNAAFGRTPERVNQITSLDSLPSYIRSLHREPSKVFTVSNYYSQLLAMISHNIARHFNGKMEDAAKTIKAEIHMIVSKTDLLLNPASSIRLAGLLNCEITILENNCGHLAIGCELDRCHEIISAFLKK